MVQLVILSITHSCAFENILHNTYAMHGDMGIVDMVLWTWSLIQMGIMDAYTIITWVLWLWHGRH